MLKNKILLKITGSIAAYKTATLISKLVQNNYEVQTVVTKDALNFIGKATLEGLTGRPVYTDLFENGKMMSHINLVKWADITIVVPASGNTINKIASGISDNLVSSLFLAHDWNKPYIIVPAMNTNMYEHPATQESISKLKNWGVKVLPTNKGLLACGDVGYGKMIEPADVYNFIRNELNTKCINSDYNILITAGGTKEYIDGVRYITNLSTGNTAALIAQYYIDNGFNVTFLHSIDSITPKGEYNKIKFTNFDSLHNSLKNLLSHENYDLIIHNAAVSDYTINEISIDSTNYEIPLKHKLSSNNKDFVIKLAPNFKIVNKLKSYSKNENVKLVSFKFTDTNDQEEIKSKISTLRDNSNTDIVVHNDLSDRQNNIQQNFNLHSLKNEIIEVKKAIDIAPSLLKLLNNNKEV